MRLDRHQIVYLDPAAWPALVGAQPDLTEMPAIAEWAVLNRPLIARRPVCGDAADRVPLGLPLPPSMGKRRLTFAAAPDAILSTDLPPLLADVAATAPAEWRPAIAMLVAVDPDVRCFGSLAWEYLTGLRYLSATSDIDLLWRASTPHAARCLVTAIAGVERATPMRIDGEIVLPGGHAIQWREWASEAPELLVKAWEGSRMVARDAVFA